MFSLGTGAAVKQRVDIASEFELLPGTTIKIDQSMEDINDLGHASHSATPIPTDNSKTLPKQSSLRRPSLMSLRKRMQIILILSMSPTMQMFLRVQY